MNIEHLLIRNRFSFGKEIILTETELSHLRSLRIFSQDKYLEFRDGFGMCFVYFVKANSKAGELFSQSQTEEKPSNICIATAIPKSGRLEFLLEKGTEMGVSKFIFVNFLQSDRKEINLERANKTISEALSQSKGHFFPEIIQYDSLSKFLLKHAKEAIFLDPYSNTSIQENPSWNCIPIIGPEGGLRNTEISLLQEAKVSGYSIGNSILKIETACIFMTSILKYYKV